MSCSPDKEGRRMKRTGIPVLILGLAIATLSGCFGPRALQKGRLAYNRAVRATEDQELLLNIVRLRYLDGMKFLTVGAISTQFSFDASAGALTNTLVNDRRHPGFKLDGGIAERPTISYAPAEGEEFTKRLATPVELPLVALMSSSGWPVDRILLLAMSHVNGVPNTPFTDFSADGRPDNRAFRGAVEALARLQSAGGIELAYQESLTTLSPEVALPAPTSADVMAATAKGLEYHRHASGEGWVLQRRDREPALRFSPSHTRSEDARRVRATFGLKPDRSVYPVRMATQGQTGSARAGWNGDALWVTTRSLTEIMYYLSVGVQVPAGHLKRGYAPVIKDRAGATIDWSKFLEGHFRVETGDDKPDHTSLAVKHRGHWFWIAEGDLASRSRMSDVAEMFNLVVRAGGAVQAPVLTLPIGR
jgi:hypothetical protein